MPEKNLVIDSKELKYEGIFDIEKLLRTFDSLFEERGYKRKEKEREETATPEGKSFFIELRPVKPRAAYYVHNMVIKIYAKEIKDVMVTVDKRKQRLQSGKLKIVFNAWEITDYWMRWEQAAWYALLKGFFEKFFFKVGADKYRGELFDDAMHVYNNIKAHLNLYKFIVK